MKRPILQAFRAGYTLVEVLVATAVFASIGGMVYNFFSAGTVLYAKNVSVNYSNSFLRGALDRVNLELSQATDIPELVNIAANGTISTATNTAAAGIRFDKYLGGPYVMEGTVASNSATFSMKRSTNTQVTAPPPVPKDVIVIDGAPPASRSIVATCTPGSIAAGLQSLAITLQSGSTAGTSWTGTSNKTASLVRKVAIIVVGNELRFYDTMEGVSAYNSAPNTYQVLTSDIGTNTIYGEDKPFTLVTKNGKLFVSLVVRVQSREFDKVMAKKESREFNTSLRIDTLIHPRNAP